MSAELSDTPNSEQLPEQDVSDVPRTLQVRKRISMELVIPGSKYYPAASMEDHIASPSRTIALSCLMNSSPNSPSPTGHRPTVVGAELHPCHHVAGELALSCP